MRWGFTEDASDWDHAHPHVRGRRWDYIYLLATGSTLSVNAGLKLDAAAKC
jgi:hypothetical protein